MITKRISPCLDVRDGRVVKGVNFEGLHDVSSPVELAKYYSANGADVVMTVCDGKVLYENGEYKTIDLEKVLSYDRIHFCK